MKVKTKLVITDELKAIYKSFSLVSRSQKTAYVFMNSSHGTVMLNSKESRAEHRTAKMNEKIISDLAKGVGSTSVNEKAKPKENAKPRRKYIRKKPLAPISSRTLPPRNPVFLSDNELKAVTAKAGRILGEGIDPIKQYEKVTRFLSEIMVYYFKKHIETGIMENGPVAALKEKYEKHKIYLYGKLPVLVRTGQLIKSFLPRVR